MNRDRTKKLRIAVCFVIVSAIIGIVSSIKSKKPQFDPSIVIAASFYDLDPRFIDYINKIGDVPKYDLKSDDARLLFANVIPDSTPIWKGAFLAVVETSTHEKFHLAVSHYGGYFKVLETGQRLRFLDESVIMYEQAKDAALKSKFLPARNNAAKSVQSVPNPTAETNGNQ